MPDFFPIKNSDENPSSSLRLQSLPARVQAVKFQTLPVPAIIASSLLILSFAVGCSGALSESPGALPESETNQSHHANPANVDSVEGQIDSSDSVCPLNVFDTEDAMAQTDGDNWFYRSVTTDSGNYLRMDILAEWGGPTGPGTYSLDGTNYKDCSVCVLGFSGCNGEDGCERVLYASQGVVEITSLGTDPGSRLTGIFHNVKLQEVFIDGYWTSTVIEGGETWCFDRLAFDEELFGEEAHLD